MVLYDFTLTIDGPQGSELVKTVTAESRQDAIDKIGSELVARGSVNSITEFKNLYQVSQTKYSFANAPWNEGDDLTDVFNSIDGVSYVRYSDPYSGAYEPPTFYLGLNNDKTPDKIKQAVEDYFDGFSIEIESQKVVVQFNSPV